MVNIYRTENIRRPKRVILQHALDTVETFNVRGKKENVPITKCGSLINYRRLISNVYVKTDRKMSLTKWRGNVTCPKCIAVGLDNTLKQLSKYMVVKARGLL